MSKQVSRTDGSLVSPESVLLADHKHSRIFLRKDGMVEIDCIDDHEYTVEEVKENHEVIRKAAGENKLLVISYSKQYTTANKDVRTYIATAPHQKFVMAEAFVIHTMGQWLLGEFFMKTNKPKVPAKFFRNKREAEGWLKSFKN